jgi:hypothetical protein
LLAWFKGKDQDPERPESRILIRTKSFRIHNIESKKVGNSPSFNCFF